jgi:transcriptional regulator with GAF, ATPase, and Fis domain
MKSFAFQETIKTLNLILDIEQPVSGVFYLRELVRNIGHTFDVKYVLVGHGVAPENVSVQTDVVWAENDYSDNFIYGLRGTPCENVLSGNRVCVYPKDVAGKYPEDKLLVEMGVESYIGAPMLKRDGELSGIIALLDDKPIEDVDFFTAIIEFLAVRIGLELERHYNEEELKRQVIERTSELEKTNKELKIALAEIKTLRGIIPICSNCKKIRDDQGFWQQVESYVTKRTEASFSHGICPVCVEKLYGDLDLIKKK